MQESVDSLFHYTDINAVCSIVKNRKIWLTNVGFLNDSREFHDGMSVVADILNTYDLENFSSIEQAKKVGYLKGLTDAYKVLPDVNMYTCSFSRAPNLLSQWRAYGNFAIEFSRLALEKVGALYDCCYMPKEKEEICRRSFELLAERQSRKPIGEYDPEPLRDFMLGLLALKNMHFREEHEVRMVDTATYEMTEVKFRSRGDFLIPYLEKEFGDNCIKALHIGPIANQDLAKRSLDLLLRSCGLRDLPVYLSDIPFRS
ncbi:DUF2971 domain-containing protein [Pseudomonas asiatica]|uniref:DUF2971 domain-containing protein n=1 Tax=Pseudomonas asiatica TaxID=2219225 RepID=UPI0010C0B1C3|nr:DUF2971 domain-containing protein [Pseudomonas asiatica]